MEPEIALWMGVLEQAMNDAKLLIRRARAKPELWSNVLYRSEVSRLKRWFRAKSQEPGGFGFVCDVVGADPEQALSRMEERFLRHMDRRLDKQINISQQSGV